MVDKKKINSKRTGPQRIKGNPARHPSHVYFHDFASVAGMLKLACLGDQTGGPGAG